MKGFLFLILLLIYSVFYGQTTPYAFSLNKVSDMPSDMVFDVLQDERGFVWFGTAKGVSRFDGIQLKRYTSGEFPVKAVSNLHQDSKGRIWFQDFNGNIFYTHNGRVELFKNDKANGFLRFGIIGNKLFVAAKEYVNIYDLNNFKKIKSLKTDLKWAKQTTVSQNRFYLLGDKIQYVTGNAELKSINLPTDYLTRISAPVAASGKSSLFIFSKFDENYAEIKDDQLQFRKLPFKTSFTQNVNIIKDKIWICSTKGIYEFDPKTHSYRHFFSDSNISYIIKTQENHYWVSTLNQGAFYVEDFSSSFIKTPAMPMRMAKSGSEIYFSTNREAIFKFDEELNFKQLYQGNSDHAISPMLIDSLNNRLLFGSSKFIIKSPNSQLENILPAKHIVQLDEKYYAVSASTWNGIIYTDPKKKSRYDHLFTNLPHIEQSGIHLITIIDSENGKDVIFNPKEKSIYFITNYGLKRFKDGKVEEIATESNQNFVQLAFLNNRLYLLSEDEILYELADGKLKTVKLPDGLSNSKIQKIRSIKNRIYIYKDQAVYGYNTLTNKALKIIDIPKDLDFYDVVQHNNHYYFASNKGIIKTSAHQTSAVGQLKVYINSVLVNGRNSKELNLKNLKHTQNNIEIDLDIVSESPNNVYGILYRIDAGKWETLSNTTRTLKFSSLSYGEHDIELQIINGRESILKSVSLLIDPPFYLKTWFIMSMILLSLLLAYLYFRWILKKVNIKNQKELDKVNLEKLANQSKLKSLKSQMNPHFFFNALNTLQSYILSNEKKEAVSYLSKFSKLTRSILEMSEKETISIREEVGIINTYLEIEKARFNGDFHYHVHVDEGLDIFGLQMPTLLLQPFIENAVKHGLLHKNGEKNLKTDFNDKGNFIEITVDDDGIGRKMSAELNALKNSGHVSFATQSLEQRIELLNLNNDHKICLTYTDKPYGKGTTVTLLIPKNQQ